LAREVLDQIDLLIGEGLNLLAIDGDDSNQVIVCEHRDIQNGPIAAELNGRDAERIALCVGLFRSDVANVHYLLGLRYASEPCSGAGTDQRLALSLLRICRWHVVKRNGAKAIALAQPQDAEPGLADARGILHHRLEYRLELARRT
jgi:hypothetical protein